VGEDRPGFGEREDLWPGRGEMEAQRGRRGKTTWIL
jgi:hypothetical protein